jgi:OmpA family
MRWQGISSRLAVTVLLSTAICASIFVATASAQGSLSVTCVASSATQCVVTIPLVSNMDEDVVVALPANKGFSMNQLGGTPGSAPSYTSLNDGYWSGTGTSWTCCLLQTGSSEPAGAVSTMTFSITPLTSSPTSTVPAKQPKKPAALNLNFAAGSFSLSASDKSQLQALARKLKTGAKVTITGYALSNPTLARNRALSVADYLYARVKVNWKVVSVSTRSLNRVTVTTTAL